MTVISLKYLEQAVGLSRICKRWIIYISSVKHLAVSKTITNLVIVDFEYCRSNCGILGYHLLDEHQNASLIRLIQIHLELSQSFRECCHNL